MEDLFRRQLLQRRIVDAVQLGPEKNLLVIFTRRLDRHGDDLDAPRQHHPSGLEQPASHVVERVERSLEKERRVKHVCQEHIRGFG
jgi:hypothetical protein